MASQNTINVGVNVSDNGTVSQLQIRLKDLQKQLTSVKNALKQTGSGIAGGGGPTKQENIEYRNARGVAGTGTGGSRDFAKQAQGLGGLVHLYATFAANIFAVSAAFMALDKAAQFTQMIEGAKALETTTGVSLRAIAGQMKDVTDGALSMQESMRLTALGSAAGLSQKKILELTKGAKGASLALGRDMGDSIDRVIRGVAKLEPELLDELGVVTRAQEAYKKYAQSIGVSTDALTSYQKTVAYSSAVSEELTRKFGAIADSVPANPYAKFLGQLKDVGTELLTLVNTVITPVVAALSNNIELMFAGVLLLVKSLTMRAIPEIGKMFSISPEVVKAREAALSSLLNSIDEGNKAEVESKRAASVEIIRIKEAEAAQLSKLAAKDINKLAPSAFKTVRGQTAKNLLEVNSVGSIVDDPRLRKGVTTAIQREGKFLENHATKNIGTAAEAAAANTRYTALLEIEKKIVAEESRRLVLATEISMVTKAQEAEELKIANTLRQKVGYSAAEKDAAILNLEVKKLEGAQIVQNTLYLKGQAAAEIEKAKQLEIIQNARRNKSLALGLAVPIYNKDPQGNENKNFGESGDSRTKFLGTVSEGADKLKDSFKDVVSKVGAGVGKVVGFLGTWGVAAMVAFEALSFLADQVGWLNSKTDELNASLEEGTKVLETAQKSYDSYNKAIAESVYSLDALQRANGIASSTLEQGTASIQKQIEVFTAWKNAGGWITSFWDRIGTSKFDTLKENITNQVDAMSKVATGAQKAELQALTERIAGTKDSAEGLKALAVAYVELEGSATRAAEASKNQTSFLKDFQDKANAAASAIEKINEKEFIKDEKRRTVVEFLTMLQKGLADISLSATDKINLLAKIPEGLTSEAGKRLDAIRKTATEIQAIEEAIAKNKKEQRDINDTYLGEFKALSDADRASLDTPGSSLEERRNKEHELLRSTKVLENKLNSGILSNKEYLETQSEIKLNALRIGYLNSSQRALELKKRESAKDYAEYEAAVNRRSQDANLSWYEGTLTRIWQRLLDWVKVQNWFGDPPTKPKEDPKKPNGAFPSFILGDMVTRRKLDTEKKNLDKMLEDEKKYQIEQDKKSNGAGAGAALEKEALSLSLKYSHALIAQQEQYNKLQETNTGHIGEQNILALESLKIDELVKAQKIETLDINDKYAKSNKDLHMTEAKRKELLASALLSSQLEFETKEKILKSVTKESLITEKLFEYKTKVRDIQDRELESLNSKLDLDKEAGTLSREDIINREAGLALLKLEVEKQDLLNKLKAKGVLNPELQPGLVNPQDTAALAKNEADQANIRNKLGIQQTNATKDRDQSIAENRIASIQSIMDMQKDEGKISLKLLGERFKAEEALYNTKIDQAKNDPLKQEALRIEHINKLYKDQQELLEAKKRGFADLSTQDKTQTVYDEAAKRARDFAASMKDTVTGTFDAIYSGMDAAIDEITTKMMKSEKINIKEIVDLFRNTAAEGFRQMAADQLKSSARNLIKDIMGAVLPGVDVRTNEEKAIDYAKRTAEGIEKMAGMGPGGGGAAGKVGGGMIAGILGAFKSDAPGMEGQTAFSNLSLSDKLDSNSGFNMNSAADNAENAASSAEYFANATDEAGNKLIALGDTQGSFISRIGDSFSGLLGPQGLIMSLFSGLGGGLKSVAMSILNSITGGSSGGGGGGILGSLVQMGISYLTGSMGGMSGSEMSAGFAASGQGMAQSNYMAGASNYTPSWNDTNFAGPTFANGGIMSEYGALKLNKYANGGIANSPQMAVFGEGRMNEAYVPLPDGRTIPVTMQGGSNTGSGQVNIVVNVDAKGTADTQTTGASNAQDAKQLGMIISGKVREEIVNQQRSGGLLNKR